MKDILKEINAHAESEDFEFAALQEAKNYRRSLLSEFGPYLQGRILEVGAGIGQMTSELAATPGIETLEALEPDTRFYTRLLESNPGVRCHPGTLAQLDSSHQYDGIILINVLEHIEDDFAELKTIRQHLVPGGKICLFVPAFQEIYSPMDRSFGHFRRYQQAKLGKLLEEAGFQIIKMHYYNSLGFFAWWMNFCVLKKTTFEINKVRFYDRYLFPLVHYMESKFLRPPFGQSVLAIAQAR